MARRAVPAFRAPQLTTLVDTVPAGSEWLFEMKYDGYRCMAAISGATVQLYTRRGLDWTHRFAALVPALGRLTKGSALLDGEVCALHPGGRTDFSTLTTALSTGGPLVFFAFDLLEENGRDLAALPLVERKAALERLLGPAEPSAPVQYVSHVLGHGQAVFDALCHDGFEGLIAKQANAPYQSGLRTRSWLKVKCGQRQEFVIIGWTPSTRKHTFASLLLGTQEHGTLVYRGRVGTGFTMESAVKLQRLLDARARRTSPVEGVPRPIARSARWVKPDLVAEIAYTELTPDKALRHPSFIGLREDKPADDVALERRAVDVAERNEVAGVRLTSPDRVVYPDQGVTKADLAGYYETVADRMLPFIERRPLSLLRCPQGRAKFCFFQKHDTGGFPDAMLTVTVTEKSGEAHEYYYVTDAAGLIAGTQMNVLEWHLWGSRVDDIEHPDRLVFDVDPDEGLGFDAVCTAAETIGGLLDDLGLQSFPMITGGKGVHVTVPVVPDTAWPDVKRFCRAVAEYLAGREPARFVATMSKARRKGKLFIDYLRNERGSTAVAPWSTRARAGAPVAVPVRWEELGTLPAANGFSLAEAMERARGDDPWTGYFDVRQSVGKAVAALSRQED